MSRRQWLFLIVACWLLIAGGWLWWNGRFLLAAGPGQPAACSQVVASPKSALCWAAGGYQWLSYGLWSLYLYYASLPQLLVWTMFVVLTFMVAIQSFMRRRPRPRRPLPAAEGQPGRVATLARWLRAAGQQPYSHQRLVRHLDDLAQAAGRPSSWEAINQADPITGPSADAPIRRRHGWLWGGRRRATPADYSDLETLVAHLERELEVANDHDAI